MNAVKRLIRSAALALCLLACAGPASAVVEPLRDGAALDRWIADAAGCRGDFLDGLQDRRFLDRLSALGVVFKTVSEEGDIPEGEFTAPRPVEIAGQKATHFLYWGDSGAEFYAIVAGPADAVAKAAGVKAVPTRLQKDFDERTIGVRFARAKKADEQLAPMVFVRRAEKGDGGEIGCRYFDG